MASEDVIEAIARRLAEAIPPRSKILLLGSQARGDDGARSDIDVLVIEPSVEDPMRESVRLRRVLRGVGVPIDVLVIALVARSDWLMPWAVAARYGASIASLDRESALAVAAAAIDWATPIVARDLS